MASAILEEAQAVLVAGGSGGLGSAICARLAVTGASVAIGYRSRKDVADELAAKLGAATGSRAMAVPLDLLSDAECTSAVTSVLEAFGRLDTVIYAAGPYIPQRWISNIAVSEVDGMLLGDAGAFFRLVSATLPALRETSGAIVALSTPAVARHIPKDSLSSVPKAAIESLVRALAAEEGRFGVRANSVAVGLVDVGMFRELLDRGDFTPSYVDAALGRIPLRRAGTAADIAEAVAFLVGHNATYITGQHLAVDGGLSV